MCNYQQWPHRCDFRDVCDGRCLDQGQRLMPKGILKRAIISLEYQEVPSVMTDCAAAEVVYSAASFS